MNKAQALKQARNEFETGTHEDGYTVVSYIPYHRTEVHASHETYFTKREAQAERRRLIDLRVAELMRESVKIKARITSVTPGQPDVTTIDDVDCVVFDK